MLEASVLPPGNSPIEAANSYGVASEGIHDTVARDGKRWWWCATLGVICIVECVTQGDQSWINASKAGVGKGRNSNAQPPKNEHAKARTHMAAWSCLVITAVIVRHFRCCFSSTAKVVLAGLTGSQQSQSDCSGSPTYRLTGALAITLAKKSQLNMMTEPPGRFAHIHPPRLRTAHHS